MEKDEDLNYKNYVILIIIEERNKSRKEGNRTHDLRFEVSCFTTKLLSFLDYLGITVIKI
jgi:hypothetical protein